MSDKNNLEASGKSPKLMPTVSSLNNQSEMTNILKMMEKLLHWAAIVESSDDAIISKSMEGYITSWNTGAEKLYGYTAEEIVGKPVSVLMPADREDDFPNIMRELKEGRKVDHYETRRKTKDGRVIDVSITVSPIKDASGKVIGASKIARDISEQIEYQKRREDFVSAASHELKTPITTQKVYEGLLKNLMEKNGDQEYLPYLQKMMQQTEKLHKLVNDLLQVSRGYMGQLQLDKTKFYIEDVLEEIINDLQKTTKHKLLQIRHEPKYVYADKDRTGQVFTNLLNNAIKYSAEDKEIIVSTFYRVNEAVVSVQDFGIGIEEKYYEKIFEKFYRVNNGTYPGMGIGLALSSEIMKRQGGNVWLESEVGKGSTFYFSLPMDEES